MKQISDVLSDNPDLLKNKELNDTFLTLYKRLPSQGDKQRAKSFLTGSLSNIKRNILLKAEKKAGRKLTGAEELQIQHVASKEVADIVATLSFSKPLGSRIEEPTPAGQKLRATHSLSMRHREGQFTPEDLIKAGGWIPEEGKSRKPVTAEMIVDFARNKAVKKQPGFSKDQANKILGFWKEMGYIDDRGYASELGLDMFFQDKEDVDKAKAAQQAEKDREERGREYAPRTVAIDPIAAFRRFDSDVRAFTKFLRGKSWNDVAQMVRRLPISRNTVSKALRKTNKNALASWLVQRTRMESQRLGESYNFLSCLIESVSKGHDRMTAVREILSGLREAA